MSENNNQVEESLKEGVLLEEEKSAASGGGVPQKVYDELLARFQEAEQKSEKQWDAAVRSRAELENYRRRAERDLENAHKYNIEKFANEMLPILDSLESAFGTVSEDDEKLQSTREGLALTLKMFTDGITKFGITTIDPINQTFDPMHHEALSMVENSEVANNTVLVVVQKGYKIHDRFLRPARVVVSRVPLAKPENND